MGAASETSKVAPASEAMEEYFRGLRAAADRAYAAAQAARTRGFDPVDHVEVVLAEDLAARVEAQTEVPGIASRVRQLARELGNRELVAFQAAKEVATGRFAKFGSKDAAIDKAVRVGLSIITEGVVVAPLEGIAKAQIGSNSDGTDYVDLHFAGPIRAAGGGAQAMSVFIADVVRRELGVGAYRPTDAEVERYQEEIPAYKRAANLQYTPTTDEIAQIVRHCPVCVNGEGTEKVEVTGHRDLPRVETNRLRGGACLVIAEGLCLKAPKILKHVQNLGLEGWEFLEHFVAKKPEPTPVEEEDEADAGEGSETDEEDIEEIHASDKFIKDLIGGRPVFAHPSRPGGFRLRYGRAPTAGLASTAVSPVTMHALDDFLAVGTQLKVERPGKGTIATPCDTLEGPTLLLANGDLVRVDTLDAWRRLPAKVSMITDLGEILIPYGEFVENNQLLVDSSYVHEWWIQDLEAVAGADAAADWRGKPPSYEEALGLSKAHGVPLHPDWTLLWHDLDTDGYHDLRRRVAQTGRMEDTTLSVPDDPLIKDALVRINGLHVRREGRLRVSAYGRALVAGLGLTVRDDGTLAEAPVEYPTPNGRFPVVPLAAAATGVPLKPRAPTRLGARMGRPEKADARKMNPPVHALYPLAQAGGQQRKVSDALKSGKYESVVGRRRCTVCGRESYLLRCRCGGGTQATPDPPTSRTIQLKDDLAKALSRLGMRSPPEPVKGVIGLMSAAKVPEPIEKGILRAHHGVYTFKDGTVRFDMTDAPLTHFKPRDVGVPVGRLVELGYTHDAAGEVLARDDQLLELKAQDVVLARAGGEYLLAAAKYIDDLLERFYETEAFYRAATSRDLVGHLVVGLAPHTSAGVLARIIGFSDAQVGWGHPYFHAAKRRNCMPGDTEVLIQNSPSPGRTSLADLYERGGPETTVDSFATARRPLGGVQVLAVDPDTGHVTPRTARAAYKVAAPEHLVSIRTRSGRRLRVSPHHRLEVFDGRRLAKRQAMEARPGDRVAFAWRQRSRTGATTHGLREQLHFGDVALDEIVHVSHEACPDQWLYDLEVDEHHNFLADDLMVVSNCDGDEDAVMLLMDCFLNFSRSFVPDRRGGLMDLPLVLTTRIDPNEIDKEAHNVDCAWQYPRAFYEATERHLHPKEVRGLMDLVENRLGTPAQYEGLGVTHFGSSIHQGPVSSSYKTLGAMLEKMDAQLGLADRIRAVDAVDVADRVISTHLLPDLLGNLKAFTRQKVRCTKCNKSYRRVTLTGRCTKVTGPNKVCGNTLTLTVHEKSVKKYLQVVQELEKRYDLPDYTRQRIALAKRYLDDAFAPEKYVTPKLGEFAY